MTVYNNIWQNESKLIVRFYGPITDNKDGKGINRRFYLAKVTPLLLKTLLRSVDDAVKSP